MSPCRHVVNAATMADGVIEPEAGEKRARVDLFIRALKPVDEEFIQKMLEHAKKLEEISSVYQRNTLEMQQILGSLSTLLQEDIGVRDAKEMMGIFLIPSIIGSAVAMATAYVNGKRLADSSFSHEDAIGVFKETLCGKDAVLNKF